MENKSCEISYIYGLVDPRNNEIRYIGKTKNPKSLKELVSCIFEASKKINVLTSWNLITIDIHLNF